MGQALYRKHRSRALSEIIGQEHITKTLSEALKQGRISHAYLLTGPRGVGKTSVARILAHEINGLPYDDDSTHIDIIEIDAASNRRIDEIRELRDKVYIAPAEAKYKVYIIDEVHMLTREAFNALLKTLEEPPEHVVFILATTDAHKLPETIVSRTQRFSFKPVSKEAVVKHLADIAKQEKITISAEALELLAQHGEGSFRDSISMLDQVGNNAGAIEVADVRRQLGLPPAESVAELLEAVVSGGEPPALMHSLDQLYEQGYQPAAIAKQFSEAVRRQLSEGTSPLGHEKSLRILGKLIDVPSSRDPAGLLEIILLSALAPSENIAAIKPSQPSQHSSGEHKQREQAPPALKAQKPEKPAAAAVETPSTVKNSQRVADTKPGSATVAADTESTKQPETGSDPKAADESESGAVEQSGEPANMPLNDAIWPQVLAALKKKHNTLYSVARMAQPHFADGTLQLTLAFAFHKKRLSEQANQQLLLDTIRELTGHDVQIEFVVDATAEPPAVSAIKPASDDVATGDSAEDPPELSAISSIFGGGELLES